MKEQRPGAQQGGPWLQGSEWRDEMIYIICGWCLRVEALKWCWEGVGPVDGNFQLDRFSWTFWILGVNSICLAINGINCKFVIFNFQKRHPKFASSMFLSQHVQSGRKTKDPQVSTWMQLKFNLVLTSFDLCLSSCWYSPWHNSSTGVINVLVDRMVSRPACHRFGHRPSRKRWRSTKPSRTSSWKPTSSATKEHRPGARQGAPLGRGRGIYG